MPLCLPVGKAVADDRVLAQVNKNIVMVYTSAAECMYTLSPGPDQYVQIIKDYFSMLYPKGTGYWVLPVVTEYEQDRNVCITNLESGLLRYQRSLYDFHNTYPNRPQPPMLLAYKWRESGMRSGKSGSIIQPQIPIPLRSEKTEDTEKRFK